MKSDGDACFDNVMPNALYRALAIETCLHEETALGVHVVINDELHLCQSEELAIAVLDSNTKCNKELYVYCAETETLVLHGAGIVTGIADCAYHIREILDDQIKAREADQAKGQGNSNDPSNGPFNQAYEG
ncbi:hypothetical protein PFOEGONH_00051 [Klebsiella phage vB_KppS-Pokey]|nr:hypothetical protein PFOEGONH_00051 [Klebsiella phage vB_KppS-Pokey]